MFGIIAEKSMQEMSDRANINYYDYNGKPVIIFESHRTSLRVLKHAIDCGYVTSPVNMLIFDKHDDFCDPICGLEKLQNLLAKSIDERILSDFVEWDLSRNNDDWIKTGMHLGYIADVLLIGTEKNHNVTKLSTCESEGVFTDISGRSHHIYTADHIWNGLDYQGWISDGARRRELEPLWQIIGWNPRQKNFFPERNFVLDIDLDCFSSSSWDQTLSMRTDVFNYLFTKRVGYSNMSAKDWMIKCIDKAKYISIATESVHCGGIYEMMNTFYNLDKALFDKAIGKHFL